MGKPEELESLEDVIAEIETQGILDAVNEMLDIFSAVPPEFRKDVLRHVTRIGQEIINEGQ